MNSATLAIVIVIAVIAVAAIVGGMMIARKKRSQRLREHFGPEYDRAMEDADSQREAESQLRERTKRHKKLELHSLKPEERADFDRRWSEVQGEFVDDPGRAVRAADNLVVDVMSARGYPVGDFDRRAEDLSVSHPEITQRYREARRVAKANADGRADTEDLRKAVANYRDLVRALLHDGDDADRRSDRSEQRDEGRPDTGRADMGRGRRDAEPDSADGRHSNGHLRDDQAAERPADRDTGRETRA